MSQPAQRNSRPLFPAFRNPRRAAEHSEDRRKTAVCSRIRVRIHEDNYDVKSACYNWPAFSNRETFVSSPEALSGAATMSRPRRPAPPGQKHCHRCDMTLSVERFARDASKSDGLRVCCRSCDAKRLKASYWTKERRKARRTRLGTSAGMPRSKLAKPDCEVRMKVDYDAGWKRAVAVIRQRDKEAVRPPRPALTSAERPAGN